MNSPGWQAMRKQINKQALLVDEELADQVCKLWDNLR